MKFNLNHDPNNKTLAIPRAALQLSGLAGVSDLILHTDSGCILLLPGDPTVAELLKTISLISAVAPQLISRLAERSQMAMEAGMTETACGACEHEPHCSGLEIPASASWQGSRPTLRWSLSWRMAKSSCRQRRKPPQMCSSTSWTMMFAPCWRIPVCSWRAYAVCWKRRISRDEQYLSLPVFRC